MPEQHKRIWFHRNRINYNDFNSLMMIIILSILSSSTLLINAFNLDTFTALIQRGPTDTYFGFSVALHKDRNVSWLLAGAPLAQTDQPNVEHGGAVYRCSIDSINTCQQIQFDRTGPSVVKIKGHDYQEDEKSNQWFGATLHSQPEGPIVACAPRFVYFTNSLTRRDPIGTCWISRGSFTGFYQYSPCRNNNWGYHRQGSCQAGIAAAVTKNGKQLFIGAPGSLYWQGQIFEHDLELMTSIQSKNKALSSEDDSFLGYSITVGQFSGLNDRNYDAAVGMPKGNNHTGKVVIFNSLLQNIANISGEQMGSYFGYSLATADINGDGLDDIIIGAPLYSSPNEKDQSYEKGRIYVALQNRDHQFRIKSENGFVSGKTSKGRFGLSIASLGDINKDGFDDLAVGAPYDGPNSNGIVYILLGSRNGIITEFSQTIHAEDISDPGLRTFGYSLSGGMDIDSNTYNDLLIGAYQSDRIILMKARPVVNVTATLQTTKDNINLEDRDCTTNDGNRALCVTIKVCLSYSGVGVDNRLEFHYRTTLDASVSSTMPRLYFLHKEHENEEELVTILSKGQTWCKERQAYFINNVRDKLTPINITLEYWLPRMSRSSSSSSLLDQNNIPIEYPMGTISVDSRLTPILNNVQPSFLSKQLSIRKNCGYDNICKPDLSLSAKLNVDEYVVGSRKKLLMSVWIKNQGEDSYETIFNMRMPYDVQYIRINKSAAHPEIVCYGARPELTGVNDLTCDIGNPLRSGKTAEFIIIMEPAKINSATTPNYLFLMNVTSANIENENQLENNRYEIGIPLRVQADLNIFGLSEPEVISYNYSTLETWKKPQNLEDIGREFSHSYTVQNKGMTTISRAEITILWPTRDLRGNFLFYLIDQVQIKGRPNKGFCRTITRDDLNPLGLKSRRSNNHHLIHRQTRALPNIFKRKQTTTTTEDSEEAELQAKYKALTSSCLDVAKCTKIECIVQELETNESVVFTIRSRFWKEQIQLVGLEEFEQSSKMIAMITALPYDVHKSFLQPTIQTIKTKIFVTGMGRIELIPLWLIIAAILIGLLILAILACCLWKLGFFKRKRPPSTSSDREPLRNSSL
ncbi:hypothetical protein DERP_005526 [Dermatophagoides pteronyssinus]|uniref:Integrin alpha-8-like n=1 Tax=Dermatophagoides pteronyssinus TaxID=6956 RepID=A0ABQ8JNQ7_DERPT|nr:hypothetical protein DERP_005526 [Dermatophagoides pteronyssinus]